MGKKRPKGFSRKNDWRFSFKNRAENQQRARSLALAAEIPDLARAPAKTESRSDYLLVKCPDCGADVDVLCFRADRGPSHTARQQLFHRARKKWLKGQRAPFQA